MGQPIEQHESAAKTAGAELIPSIIQEFLPILAPGLPSPKVVIVDTPGAAYLARDLWVPGEGNTTLKIQKAVLGDETTLRRIIAHELCHHEGFLSHYAPMPDRQRDLLMKVEGGHGAYFKRLAEKFNARFGAGFVTETSDSAMVEDDGRTYIVLLRRKPETGQLLWSWAIRPSTRQREYLTGILDEGRIHDTEVNPADYKLVQTRDRIFSQGPAIGRGMARVLDPGVNAKLKQLWEDAPALQKTGALESNIIDGTDEVAKVVLKPRLGFHYDIFMVKDAKGTYSGEMHRMDQDLVAPPYRLGAKSLGELTRAAWDVLDEGYRTKMDAARRAGDRTMLAQLRMENLRVRQDLMADVEKAFRRMPREPRRDWSKPWDFHVEGSAKGFTRQQFLKRFQELLPGWALQPTPAELLAESPEGMSWEQVAQASKQLRALAQETQVALVSRSARGRFVVTVDLTGMK